MQKTIYHNQSLLDFAIQHTGDIESLFDFAKENNLCITDSLTAGEQLIVPDTTSKDIDILNYYTNKKILPASAIKILQEETGKGIGYMKVGSTFIVG